LTVVIRRPALRLAILTAAAVVATSGCATFDNSDTVARVGSTDITNDDFEPLATEYFENPDVFGTAPIVNGRADAEQSRFLLAVMVRQQQVNQFLDEQGVDASAIRSAFVGTVLSQSPAGELSDEMQQLIADTEPDTTAQALALVDVPGNDELRTMYARNPASIGLICARHILAATEADALDLLDELSGGADFATLATERSIDPTAAENGGALTSGTNQCIPVQTVRQTFDPAFTAGVLVAREGAPSVPVESAFGWHVILHRPWDEVASSISELHQPGESGGYLLDGAIATSEVAVDPRLGTWDTVTGTVAPAG
jgi:hypothetical protein